LKNFCFHNFVFPDCDIRPARPSCSHRIDVVLSSKAEIPLKTRQDCATYFLNSHRSSVPATRLLHRQQAGLLPHGLPQPCGGDVLLLVSNVGKARRKKPPIKKSVSLFRAAVRFAEELLAHPLQLNGRAAVGASMSGKRSARETKSRHAVKCDG
jgi:hypothetical protein